MFNLRTIPIFLTLILTSSFSFSETEFEESVPVGLVKMFLGNVGSQEIGIYSDIFDEFPDIEIPDNFTVLGSVDQNFSKRAFLETSLPFDEAKSSLFDPLLNDGWIEIVSYMRSIPDTGFVNSFVPETTTNQVCHDEHGTMQIQFSEYEDSNLVLLNVIDRNMMGGGIQPTCAQYNEQQQNAYNPRMMNNYGVRAYMPKLEIPEEAGFVPPMMGISGSDMDARTSINIPIDWDIEKLSNHFAKQLEAQGWVLDVDWNGVLSAGGNWTSSPDDTTNLFGSLTIVRVAEGNNQLQFRILSLGNVRRGNSFFAP